jgi:tetratricopeptide (TPR) repeat protein
VVDRSAAGTRYFPDVVDRIVGPWRDAGPQGPDGRVVIVSGTPQSGRATVLGQVADDLRRAGIRVVRRVVRDGALRTVDGAGPGDHSVQGAKVLAAALQVAGVPVVGNLVALGAEIATAHRMLDGLDPRDLPADPYLHVHRVAEAVRQRAGQEPLALVIDDAHGLDTPEVWWDALFGTTLPRLAAHLPVLVVLGVERTSTATGSHALQVVDGKLVPARLAEEIPLPALDPARIERALGPVDAALLGQLRALVQGRPAWLDEVWGEWRAQGAVVQRDGRWTVAPDARDRVRTSLHGRVELALRAGAPDGDAYWRAMDVLRTAALEGQRFTVEALADVLGDDVEDLIDWIDEHLADPDGPSLLVDDGFVARAEGVEPPELRCYRFRSALVAGVLRQEVLAGTNGKELARRYARALAHAYRWSSAAGAAWTIARLAAAAGDEELVETTWRRANRLEGVAAAARLARFLVEHLDVEAARPEELAATVERLNGLNRQLVGEWDTAETLDLCRGTERAARALHKGADRGVAAERRATLLADALGQAGRAARLAGDVDDAVVLLREAAEASTRTSDPLRTANVYRQLANAESLGARGDPDRLARARIHAATALTHARRDTSPAGLGEQLGCLLEVAEVARVTGDGATAKDATGQAAGLLLDILLAPARRNALGHASFHVGDCLRRAAHLADDNDQVVVAERLWAKAARCRMKVGWYIIALSELSRVGRRLGDLPSAVQAACQALRLAQGYDAADEGAVLERLAYCAQDLGVGPADTLAVLADTRIHRSAVYVGFAAELQRDFADALARADDATREQIERDYRADRGATLLRGAFGVDVDEIDARNERLGDATEDELRGFLVEVQQYCARPAGDRD